MRFQKIINIFSLIILLAISVVLFIPYGDDYDVWWHIAYGEHFVKNSTWTIDHSIFSWTPASSDWKYVTWIGSSLLYLAYSLGSSVGLYALHTICLLLLFGSFIVYLKAIDQQLETPLILALILTSLVSNDPFYKPETFSVLLFGLTVCVYFFSRSRGYHVLFLYPLIFLVWVNTHGGFIFGLFFIFLAHTADFVTSLCLRDYRLQQKRHRTAFYALSLSCLVLLVNPYHGQYLVALFKDLFTSNYADYFSSIMAYKSLWQYLSPSNNAVLMSSRAWLLVVMSIIFTLSSALYYKAHKRIDLPLCILNLSFFLISMQYARAAFFFTIVWIFSTAFLMKHSDSSVSAPKTTIVSFILILIISGVHINQVITLRETVRLFGSRYEESAPFREADFIKNCRLPAPIFNDYLTGGFLLWRLYPDYKVFIDPRYGPYVKEGVLEDWFTLYRNASHDNIRHFEEKYHFNTIILQHQQFDLFVAFLKTKQWDLVYFDTLAVVLVRRSFTHEVRTRAGDIELGSDRFKSIDNPMSLSRLFKIYTLLNSRRDMENILAIFKQNVPKRYAFRSSLLNSMEQTLTRSRQTSKSTLQQQTQS